MISSAIWNKKAQVNFSKANKIALTPFGVFDKFTSAYLFQIAQEKSCDYLMIIYMKNFEMVKQKKRTRITQSGKNCAIQGVRLI